jgi:hypothetical protein
MSAEERPEPPDSAALTLPTHSRFPFSAITQRPYGTWSNGSRLAVYVAVNLEHFSFGSGLGAQLVPLGTAPQPDVLNWAWREWGNRVGAARLLDTLASLHLPVAVLANASLAEHAPELLQLYARHGPGAEFVGHGVTNSARQSAMSRSEEERMVQASTAALSKFSQKRPTGWLSPWIAESYATPEILTAAGYEYTLNWCHDDAPTWMETGSGNLLSVPYPQDGLNDIPAIVVRQESPQQFAAAITDAFDEMKLQAESKQGPPLVMGIALHPYLCAQPHRLGHLRSALTHVVAGSMAGDVWLCTPGDIAADVFAGALPGARRTHAR